MHDWYHGFSFEPLNLHLNSSPGVPAGVQYLSILCRKIQSLSAKSSYINPQFGHKESLSQDVSPSCFVHLFS